MTAIRLLKLIACRGFIPTLGLALDALMRPMLYHCLNKQTFVRVIAFLRLNYFVHIAKPRTFNEYILNKQLFRIDPRASVIADKYLVRAYVANLGLGHLLNELYYATDDPETIVFADFPKPYVLKANHGSGMIRIVTEQDAARPSELLAMCRKWVKTSYNISRHATERHYDSIAPRIIIEQLLRNEDQTPLLDYKFYCFGGHVEFISIVDNTQGIPLVSVYNRTWAKLSFGLYNTQLQTSHFKPPVLEEMIGIAETLSAGWDFLRVDLYLLNRRQIVFGELTFSPGGGMMHFRPPKYDFLYGEKLIHARNRVCK